MKTSKSGFNSVAFQMDLLKARARCELGGFYWSAEGVSTPGAVWIGNSTAAHEIEGCYLDLEKMIGAPSERLGERLGELVNMIDEGGERFSYYGTNPEKLIIFSSNKNSAAKIYFNPKTLKYFDFSDPQIIEKLYPKSADGVGAITDPMLINDDNGLNHIVFPVRPQ